MQVLGYLVKDWQIVLRISFSPVAAREKSLGLISQGLVVLLYVFGLALWGGETSDHFAGEHTELPKSLGEEIDMDSTSSLSALPLFSA